MYAHTSFRGAKTCKIGKKGVFFGHIDKFWKDMADKLRKNTCKNTYLGSIFIHEKYVFRVCFESPFTQMISSLKYKSPPLLGQKVDPWDFSQISREFVAHTFEPKFVHYPQYSLVSVCHYTGWHFHGTSKHATRKLIGKMPILRYSLPQSEDLAKTPVLNSTPPVLWEVHTKLVLILTPVGVSLTIWGVI